MNERVYFNSVAYKWDEMCHHDEKKIREILEASDIKEGSKILDVGTGTGVLVSYLLEKKPKKIIGVDIAEKMIEEAEKKYDSKNVEFKAMDIMDYTEKEFDYIFIYSAYPHFKDKNKLIRHLSNMLSKGGKLVIAHSDSREKINKVHGRKELFKEDLLLSAEENSKVISKYLEVDKCIDNDEEYYISAVRK